ncbi:uncharacterized protein LOC135939502 [Cloeon dipterum]|uniref:uncharacterized protein LOC135939502 n=1 Tax=Cloeon dipterum TaxID=197152 RepID=UPI00321F7F6F
MRRTKLFAFAIILFALGSIVFGQTTTTTKKTTTKKTTTTKTTTTTTKKPTTTKTTTTKKPTTTKTTTTKKPTTTKPPICNKQNFDSLKSCCKGSVGRMFTDAEIVKCTTGLSDQRLLQFTNFRMYLFYDKSNNFQMDSAANIAQLGPVPTVNECLFRLKNLIDANNSIIYENVIPLVEKASTANWISAGAPPTVSSASVATELVNVCKTVVEAMQPANLTVPYNKTTKVTSLARPFYFSQCIKGAALGSCPPTLRVNTAACNKSLSLLQTCGYFNATVPYVTK